MALDVSGRIGDSNGPTWRLVVPDDDSIGTLTISPGVTDLTWNQINGPWAAYLDQINIINITDEIQVANSINGLFANLTRTTTFNGLYHLKMVKGSTIATMDDLFFKTPAIIGYGMLGTAFWTVQVENEIGFLEIGAGEFEWLGLREVSSGIQGETEWIPTSPWDNYRINIHAIHIMGTLKINNKARNLFYFLNRATVITGLEKMITTDVTDIGGMFRNMWALSTVDISSFDTISITDMSWLFSNTWNLSEITFPNPLSTGIWSTSNVTTMESMFYNAKALTTLDVSNWDTSKITNMCCMFYRTSNLIYLDVSHWNTSNVIDMSFMFYQCGVRQSAPPYDLDISAWMIKQADMTWMFYRDKPNPNPAVPYDRANPATYQRIPDPVLVDLTVLKAQWKEAEDEGIYKCTANIFGVEDDQLLWLWDPGLTFPDCNDYTQADCDQLNQST